MKELILNILSQYTNIYLNEICMYRFEQSALKINLKYYCRLVEIIQ